MSIDALLFAPVLASTGSECSLTTRRKTGFARQKQTTTVALLAAVDELVVETTPRGTRRLLEEIDATFDAMSHRVFVDAEER
jgi:hypothetical protein